MMRGGPLNLAAPSPSHRVCARNVWLSATTPPVGMATHPQLLGILVDPLTALLRRRQRLCEPWARRYRRRASAGATHQPQAPTQRRAVASGKASQALRHGSGLSAAALAADVRRTPFAHEHTDPLQGPRLSVSATMPCGCISTMGAHVPIVADWIVSPRSAGCSDMNAIETSANASAEPQWTSLQPIWAALHAQLTQRPQKHRASPRLMSDRSSVDTT